ncbi:hypothetical protein ACIGO8_08555 [Streptomyces sp. NPDC053493]|uniref:hypothetical protein n=1 Tax=Streptomyces sp. NPDC053493 TaxID=3365705 RepID=UPI0037D8E771
MSDAVPGVSCGRRPVEARALAIGAGTAGYRCRWRDETAAVPARGADGPVRPWSLPSAALRARLGLVVTSEATEATEATAAATLAAPHGCDPDREPYVYGHPQDVKVAAEIDSSAVVPVLVDGAFQEAP